MPTDWDISVVGMYQCLFSILGLYSVSRNIILSMLQLYVVRSPMDIFAPTQTDFDADLIHRVSNCLSIYSVALTKYSLYLQLKNFSLYKLLLTDYLLIIQSKFTV